MLLSRVSDTNHPVVLGIMQRKIGQHTIQDRAILFQVRSLDFLPLRHTHISHSLRQLYREVHMRIIMVQAEHLRQQLLPLRPFQQQAKQSVERLLL